ncbi:MAG: DNA replication/repair protein RecF [Anaerolineae bacterium]|jgi:DNA replication and repair protein RecF|nr:DNA replication/repair protein RecF [Anaerolineae bacterium]
MRLTQLSLFNFRNYVRLVLDLPAGVTVLLGDNAQGKTNLLEAVYYLATSRSPHAGTDREVVNWLTPESEPLPFTRLVGKVSRAGGDLTIEITLTQQGEAEGRYRKQIRLNGVPHRAMDLLGHLNVVLFLPEDIALVSGPPGGRRHYLDATLCQIDPGYCRALSRYNQILTQRNALLRDLRERGGEVGQLAFWDEQLVEHGALLVARRRECLGDLDELVREVHAELTDGAERLRLDYLPSLDLENGETVAQAFVAQLRSLRTREIAAGVTLVGPHRDDMAFLIDGVNAGTYASRGQQRTTALALKLAEVALMSRATGERPVLLLDDVLSELDAHRRSFLLRVLDDGPQQSIITTTDLHVLPDAFVERCNVWRVSGGRLSALEG